MIGTISETDHKIIRDLVKDLRFASVEPICVSIVLLPGFDLWSVSSLIGPMRVANKLSDRDEFTWRLKSFDGAPVPSLEGGTVEVAGRLDRDIASDITFVCGGEEPLTCIPTHLPHFIRKVWRLGKVVGSIGTGIHVLAKSGVLDGCRFAIPKEKAERFKSSWPGLEPRHDEYCIDKRIITCTGSIAAARLSLQMIEGRCGEVVARRVKDLCCLQLLVQESSPEGRSIQQTICKSGRPIFRATTWIEDNYLESDCIKRMPRAVGLSSRQIQRLFRKRFAVSPREYVSQLRMRLAKSLLSETDMSIRDVAISCGYDGPNSFSRAFRNRNGIAPSLYATGQNAEIRNLSSHITDRMSG